jgi:hypothetical protein
VGNFIITDLPAATFVLTVEADGLATVRREISLASGVGLTVEIVMKATISESVTISQEEGCSVRPKQPPAIPFAPKH